MKKIKDPDSILLGKRIRTLRTTKGLTQQELGHQADVDYKFIGEIERGNMNPSFKVLVKIAKVLEVDLPEILRFEQEISDPKELESRIKNIISNLSVEKLQNILMLHFRREKSSHFTTMQLILIQFSYPFTTIRL